MGELKDILLNFGAIAGFAGIIGIAVLSMLYFSQARDVRRLREWAGREPERAGEVELRAQQIASQAIAQAYESMAYRQSEADAAAGIASEATGSSPPPLVAQDSAEAPAEPAAEYEELDPQATQAHDVLAEEFGEEPETADEDSYAVAAESAAPEASVSTPPPAEPQGQAPEAVQPPAPPSSDPALPTPSTPAAAARAAGPLPPLPPLDTSEFRAVRPPSTPTIPDSYLSSGTTGTTGSGTFEALEAEDEHRSRVPFAVAGVLVAVFAVILIGTQLLGGDDDPAGKGGTGGSAANRPAENTSNNRSQRINRAAVTVSVLNGTNTEGLAKTAADGLNKAAFTDTTTGNLADGKVHPQTIVYYASGNKAEAEEVAKELTVNTIKPATDDILAQGGSVPVIVVLGADFDQQ